LVYADCVRAARAGAGTEVLVALAPLDLMLTSVAWMTSTLAERVMTRAREVYDRLAASGPVDLASFWFGCLPILHGDATGWAAELQHEFRSRWLEILRPQGSRVYRSTVDIAAAVRTAFGDRPPGWAAARYLSPDVLVAAEDAAAVERGEFELVLGELHVASNTLGFWVFVSQHPAPSELFAETDRDHPEPRLLPMLAKEHRARLSTRTNHALVRPEDYYVGLVDYTADPHRPRTVCSADVSVELREDQLTAVLPDGRAFPAVEVFAHVLTTMSMDLFRLMPEEAHTPRVTVDRLVVARETWRVTASDLDFARDKDEARRYVRTRHWRSTTGLPRFVFVVSPAEPRPFYVDFDSPVYVNILTKAIRRLSRQSPDARLTISEMLPTPDQTWLHDDTGNSYTAELRFVAVDQYSPR
jgi:Lantibiotic dehydratase, N terminus